jgi:hypothetical protein
VSAAQIVGRVVVADRCMAKRLLVFVVPAWRRRPLLLSPTPTFRSLSPRAVAVLLACPASPRVCTMLRYVVPMLFAAGCASGEYVRSGHFEIRKEIAEKAFPIIKERASFELRCPPEELTVVTLAAHGIDDDIPYQVGVSGCGKRAVYVRSAAGWVLNSSSDTK